MVNKRYEKEEISEKKMLRKTLNLEESLINNNSMNQT